MNLRYLPHLIAAAVFIGAAALVPRSSPDRQLALRPDAEHQRIREHLLGAERVLRAADISHLDQTQRERRARAIALLRQYRQAGVFPHNHDFPGARIPYFVDRHGTLCAMAYLLARTGDEALVARVARTANNASVPELAGDPAFAAWLDRHGMTVAEAARVQPWYGCCIDESPSVDPDANYALATAGNATLAGGAVVLQLTDDGAHDTWRTLLGLAAGGTGIGLGAAGLDGTDGDAKLAALNLGVGTAALGAVAWRLFQGEDASVEDIGGEDDAALSWSAHPALSGEGGAGVRVELRF